MEGEKSIEQNIQPASDNKKSGIEFRVHRNTERGTEMEYITIPLNDIDSPDFNKEIQALLDGFYDSQGEEKPIDENDYRTNIGDYVNYLKRFARSNSNEEWFNIGPRKKDSSKMYDEQKQYMFSVKKIGNKLLIRQQPVIHGMFSYNRFDGGTPFGALTSILDKGFISSNEDGNTKRKTDKDYRFNLGYDIKMEGETGDIKNGDSYSIELFPEEGQRAGNDYATRKASANRISSVNIHLDESASLEKKEEKMVFYKKEIFEKYKVPVRFFVSVDEKDENKMVQIFPKFGV